MTRLQHRSLSPQRPWAWRSRWPASRPPSARQELQRRAQVALGARRDRVDHGARARRASPDGRLRLPVQAGAADHPSAVRERARDRGRPSLRERPHRRHRRHPKDGPVLPGHRDRPSPRVPRPPEGGSFHPNDAVLAYSGGGRRGEVDQGAVPDRGLEAPHAAAHRARGSPTPGG